jgi:hypothetical protein
MFIARAGAFPKRAANTPPPIIDEVGQQAI